MIGSESPVEQLSNSSNSDNVNNIQENSSSTVIHVTRPVGLNPHQVLLIHSDRDRVINKLQIIQLSEMWEIPQCNVHILKTRSVAETLDCERREFAEWCDDVQHDFIALELLPRVLHLVEEFVSSNIVE